MYTIGDYLLDRLNELGVEDIFGVPGDYNLTFLDHITAHPQLSWVGNANELNAAYAADGYARTKGFAALVTTFGVGELSAINGLAGSFAERVPVIEIVGSPVSTVQTDKKLVHHTLGDGDFLHFEKMHDAVTVASAHLTIQNATSEIDRVLTTALSLRRPGYINLPIDVAAAPAEKAQKKLQLKVTSPIDSTLLEKIQTAFSSAKQPVFITGHEIQSYHLEDTVAKIAAHTTVPVAALSLGKSSIDETHPQFVGIYSGALTAEPLKTYVDNADLVILLGAQLTDTATSGFSQSFSASKIIAIHPETTTVFGQDYPSNDFKELVEALTTIDYRMETSAALKTMPSTKEFITTDTLLTQNRFWEAIETNFKQNDTIVAEQGTSFFGITNTQFKKDMRLIGQPLWGSIGYTFPAALGSQLAARSKRHLLFIGDGSLQLTIQELGMALRAKLTPLIFVINNNGYTVEREIHGPNERYNDIPTWDYAQLPTVFGGTDQNVATYKVTTETELAEALVTAQADTTRLQWIEVVMDQTDAPELLKEMGRIFAKQNTH